MSVDSLSQALLYKFANPDFVRGIQSRYVGFFKDSGAKRVLDVGSGRGLFLEMLRDAGLSAVGVDSSAEQVEECRAKGFEVHFGDAIGFLERQADAGERYDGVFCSHLVEHFGGHDALRLVEGAARVLAPGGRLVMVTPNVANMEVWTRVFWQDPTHVRPYPRALLGALLEAAGLTITRSFDDRRTRRHYTGFDIFKIPYDLLRYGANIATGMDSVVVADRKAADR